MKTLVIGYGNPLRGDDAFGWAVAGHLAATAPTLVDVLTAHQLLPEHAEAVSAADRVIFVDAACRGKPGTWTVTAVSPTGAEPSLAHALDAPALLACAHDAYRARPPAFLYSAPGASFACAESLTPEVKAVVPAVVAAIAALVTSPSTIPHHA